MPCRRASTLPARRLRRSAGFLDLVERGQETKQGHYDAALGHLGDAKQAESAVKDLLQAKPEFTVDFARRHLFYIKRADQMDLYLAGLRKAGLP